MNIPKLMMVLDVESIGLHGEGFAVGWVVIEPSGIERASRLIGCSPDEAHGDKVSRDWVAANCNIEPDFRTLYTYQVRAKFWEDWIMWKNQGAELFAECLWPVEARFLNQCVEDDRSQTWKGPYPFHEIASIMLAAGMNPMAQYMRQENEMPPHNPLADARQSARLLVEAISKLKR